MSAGITTNFTLKAGKFVLFSGAEKASDRMWMLANFEGFRIYTPDYSPNFSALQQKNASYLIQFKILILQTIRNLIDKYVNEVTIEKLDIVYSTRSRKRYGIFVGYTYLQQQKGVTVVFLG